MAIDSGEVDGFFNTCTSLKITSFEKIKSGEWVVLAQLSEKPIKDLIVPNVPTIPQFARYRGASASAQIRHQHAQRFWQSLCRTARDAAGSRAALEKAFDKVFADKELMADANKGSSKSTR